MQLTQGARAPFQESEETSAYEYHKVDCWLGNKKPISEAEYYKLMNELRQRAMKKWCELNNQTKPYKCYGFK